MVKILHGRTREIVAMTTKSLAPIVAQALREKYRDDDFMVQWSGQE